MTAHQRTVEWQDNSEAVAAIPSMSGLEYLRALQQGRLPAAPIASLMNMRLTDLEEGAVTFTCSPDASQFNPIGTVHGGVVCTLLDSVLGCAVQTTLPQGLGYTSIEIKVNYLRPVQPSSGPLTAVGTVTKPGRRVAFADGTVTDKDGRLVATATGALLVFPIEG